MVVKPILNINYLYLTLLCLITVSNTPNNIYSHLSEFIIKTLKTAY